MDINPESISEYCASVSTRPSLLCEELSAYTTAHVTMSVMLSGSLVGSFLGFMVSLLRAKSVLEVGTYTGYSALCMAERMDDDGKLITLDINEENGKIAKSFWDRSPVGQRIEQRLGDAKQSLAKLSGPFDLVFIDADKPGYIEYLKMSAPLLSPAGVIVADNALYSGEVLRPISENAKALAAFNELVKTSKLFESVLLPIRDGLHVIRKLG